MMFGVWAGSRSWVESRILRLLGLRVFVLQCSEFKDHLRALGLELERFGAWVRVAEGFSTSGFGTAG